MYSPILSDWFSEISDLGGGGVAGRGGKSQGRSAWYNHQKAKIVKSHLSNVDMAKAYG